MRKTIKDKDGNETVYEGTPEELAELERRLNETLPDKPTGKRKLLKEEVKVRSLREMIEEVLARPPNVVIHSHGLCTCLICHPYPVWVAPAPEVIPYQPYEPWPGYPQPYIGDPFPPGKWYTITSNVTSAELRIDPNSPMLSSSTLELKS